MDTNEIRSAIQRIRDEADSVLAGLPKSTIVRVGGNLQAAVDSGGIIELEPATYEGTLQIRKPVIIKGNNATLYSSLGPACIVEPGTTDVGVSDLTGLSSDTQRVFLLGRNESSQKTLDSVPRRIVFTRVSVPKFLGKRAFEVNAVADLLDCVSANVWTISRQDSQGICVLNTPGPVTVRGGSHSAGSECFMVGGSPLAIPNLVPSDIAVEDTKLWRPLEWMTDDVNQAVKNIFEVKNGRRVALRRCLLDGAWISAQEGFAVMLTPHQGGVVENVIVEDNTIHNVTGIVNILGREYDIKSPETPAPTSGIVVRRNFGVTNRTLTSVAGKTGRGVFALIGGEPVDVTLEDNVGIIDGTSCVYVYGGNVIKNGASVPAGPLQSLAMTRNKLVSGKYGIVTNNLVTQASITGNTFADAPSTLKRDFPNNTFLTRAEFDALIAA